MFISYIPYVPTLQISSSAVSAKTRKLKTTWSLEASQDLLNTAIDRDVERSLDRAVAEIFKQTIETEEIDFDIVISRLKEKYPSGKAKREDIVHSLCEYHDKVAEGGNLYDILVESGVIVEEEYQFGECPLDK